LTRLATGRRRSQHGAVTDRASIQSNWPNLAVERGRSTRFGLRRARAAAAAAAIALAASACVSPPGAPVADKIRAANSPIVREVRYVPARFGASVVEDSITVILVDGTTEAQAADLWCTVIVPAGGDLLPPGALYVTQGEYLAVLPYPTTLDGKPTYTGPTCPASASPAPSS
jgi:hypothetical protein